MITEDYVSFETAKLLKEKGFDDICNAFWKDWNSELHLCDCSSSSHVFEFCHNSMLENYNDEEETNIAAPTLQMAMKWLREVHHLFIGCEPRLSFTDFYWITANIYRVRKKSSLYHTEDVDDYHCVACCDSHSYEDACEEAIKYCLENLI